MPDLDQFLDALLADVTAATRAPGASNAIKQASQRRVRVAAAAVTAVAVIAVGGGLAAETSGGSDQPSPAVDPTASSPTTKQESADPTPNSKVNAILAQAPGWAIDLKIRDDYDYAFNGPCSGDWAKDATSAADGGVDARIGERGYVGHGYVGFLSQDQASAAAAEFIDNLTSCKKTGWRVQPIPQTGAVLASSAHAVAWIQQVHRQVHVFQVPTTDGPPPESVQIEVAEWAVEYIAQRHTDEP